MVRCLALFALMLASPVLAEDGATPPERASSRAQVTVTILRGEEIGPLSPTNRVADDQYGAAPKQDRQIQHLPNDQIRIDFY